MSDEITYLGIENDKLEDTKTEAKKDKKEKKEHFKTKKVSLKLNKKIRDTKRKLFTKKNIVIVGIILAIYFFKPITFLQNKLIEKQLYYKSINPEGSSFNLTATKEGLTESVLYLSGFNYYTNCSNTMVMPVEGTITYPYDFFHQGMDIACLNYADPVYAAASGSVIDVGTDENNYKYVTLQHNINNQDIYTYYSNLSQVTVNVGDYVYQNMPIGNEGGNPAYEATFLDESGHHVHFEVRKKPQKNTGLNPQFFIPMF